MRRPLSLNRLLLIFSVLISLFGLGSCVSLQKIPVTLEEHCYDVYTFFDSEDHFAVSFCPDENLSHFILSCRLPDGEYEKIKSQDLKKVIFRNNWNKNLEIVPQKAGQAYILNLQQKYYFEIELGECHEFMRFIRGSDIVEVQLVYSSHKSEIDNVYVHSLGRCNVRKLKDCWNKYRSKKTQEKIADWFSGE